MSAVAAILALTSIAGTPAESFRYERALPAQVASGDAAFEPDGAMLGHSGPGFADLRIVDADGVRVPWRERPQGFERPRLVHRRATARRPAWNGKRRTLLTLDLGYPGTPISEIELTAGGNARYDRPVTVSGSNDGRSYTPVASGRITRAPGIERSSVSASSEYRYLRVEISNGDDPPLPAVKAELYGPSRALMVESGHRPPLTMYYGAPLAAPDYEFARLPVAAPSVVLPPSALPPERARPTFSVHIEPQSFGDRNGWIAKGALAVAALVVALSGIAVMRRNS